MSAKKMARGELRLFVQGPSGQFSLASRLLNTASFLLGSMQLAFLAMSIALRLELWTLIGASLISALSFWAIFYYNRFIKQSDWTPYIFVILCMATGAIFWPLANGWQGSLPITIPTAAVVFLPLLKRWSKFLALAAVALLTFTMAYVQEAVPGFVAPYKNEQLHLIDVLATIMIASTVSVFLMEHLRKAYEDEKQKAADQTAMLVQSQAVLERQRNEQESMNANLRKTLIELRTKEEQLLQAEKMASLGIMTAGISHEINNPVNYILTGSDYLNESLLPIFELYAHALSVGKHPSEENIQTLQAFVKKHDFEKPEIFKQETLEMLEGISNGSQRIAELVKGLRTFSRADKGIFEQVYVHQLLDASLVLLSPKYKYRIEIVKEYDSEVELIECMGSKIQQVFINLLSNAIDAIPEEGHVFVRTKAVDDWVAISIQDTGTGIGEYAQKHIFDPFFTTKSFGKGTGLGLAIVYSIVTEHNGYIDLQSVEGKGATFTVSLPIRHVRAEMPTLPELE